MLFESASSDLNLRLCSCGKVRKSNRRGIRTIVRNRINRILKQIGLAAILDAKMLISQPGSHPSAGGAVKETNLYKKWFIELFQSFLFFRQCGSQSTEPDRPSAEFLNNGQQQ